MKLRILLFISLIFFIKLNAQIGFEDYTIIDESHAVWGIKSIYVIDLDGDGDLDLIFGSSNVGINKIGWYENLGEGQFSDLKIIDNEAEDITDVYADDIDGDGDIDVLSASQGDNKIRWYENSNGEGEFGTENIINIDASEVQSIHASDMDGDGDLDVISASSYHNISWYENLDGEGNFSSEKVIHSIPSNSVYSGDIDGDGDMDVVSTSYQTISWYENLDNHGNFGSEQVINENLEGFAIEIYLTDINNDGNLDVVSASKSDRTIAWYENINGLGDFGDQQIISTSQFDTESVHTNDIDGDGDMDVISSSSSNFSRIYWHENVDGLGNFSTSDEIDTNNSGPQLVFTGDIDNDDDIDIVSAAVEGNDIIWLPNTDGLGSFSTRKNIHLYTRDPKGIEANDLDADGDIDIVVVSSYDDKVSWFESIDGEGSFSSQYIISNEIDAPIQVQSVDIDNDSDLDLVVSSERGKIYWIENIDGQANFGSVNYISNFSESFDIADIDGDGDIDLLTSDPIGRIWWIENLDGLGSFGERQDIPGNGLGGVHSADIDSDGDIDFIASGRNNSNGFVYWYENLDGQGNFDTEKIIATENNSFSSNFPADIDGDGDIDVIVGNYEIAWYENLDGLGNFGPKNYVSSALTGPFPIIAKDLDNDGDIDIVSASFIDNEIAWFENTNGLGEFQYQYPPISNNVDQVDFVSAADINNDGRIDLLSASRGDDKVAWYENLGSLGNSIHGYVRLDSDLNGCDNKDLPVSNALIITNNGTEDFATFTNSNGNYNINVNEGVFTTSISSSLPNYFISNPLVHTSSFVGLGSSDIADFCVEPDQTINDLTISLYSLDGARPGFSSHYQITYQNKGTTIMSGNIEIEFDSPSLEFLNSSIPISSQTANSLTFNYSNIEPFEIKTFDIEFSVNTPPVVEIGDILFFSATINPLNNDINEANNFFSYNQTVIDSFDPNDIQVLEGEEIYLEEADDYLHYIIRFQNTGTASAINVRVKNDLDPNLDWNTMQLENVSHANRVEIVDGNHVEFIFDNINLPDENTNEPESHGYIQYKIKPKSTVDVGDSILNQADIYFDFNPPITTNTVSTTIIENLSVSDNSMESVSVYPVPSTGSVYVNSHTKIVKLQIYNELGQLVMEKENNQGVKEIEIHKLTSGVYTIKLIDESYNKTIKKLIKK
ncbi:T9SS type A sorting domain-containing protein [Marixanthomonas spongiae]|uniref:Uncharacterized protein n=1 Tax=Marixanthomonas spongiae TaxID=2174845 RepID=A0A2U0I0E1_9FLAO|nr:T9SS type A sorting domain-containing protein [Marixanthomonas spongiae]PVW14567.1 hypothetical protein DDV96_08535 [Marixanthomonas spongiae]